MAKLLENKTPLIVAAVLAGLLSALVLAAGPLRASAELSKREAAKLDLPAREAQKAQKFGRATHERPACPTSTANDPCKVQGSITGFQVKARGARQNMFRAKELGKVVAWGIQLSKPTPDQRTGAGDLFGSMRFGKGPTARLSIIKRTKGRNYKLLRQSPIVKLNAFYGQSPIFTLNQPMRVPRGAVVALTTPTWAPDLVSSEQTKRSSWVASRSGKNNKCASTKAAKNTLPAQRVGKQRVFGCTFSDRLLYSAYFVPKHGKGKTGDSAATKPSTMGPSSAPEYSGGTAPSGGVELPN